MNLSSYDDYKDGVSDWLSTLPSHWPVSKVKYLASYVNGFAFKPTDWGEEGKEIIRIQNLTDSRGSEANYFSGTVDKKYLICRGDLLLSWSATLGLFVWDRADGWLNQHIFKVVIKNRLVKKKYYIWLANWFISNMEQESHGSTMQHVTKDKFGGFVVPLPPFDEQLAIANFLDSETARIDRLIEKQQQLIALLKEKRQAVISHTVTQGLDPDSPMKDSGVEWLGNVPAHWLIKRLKHISPKVGVGLVINPSTYVAEEGKYFLYGGDVREYCFDLANTRKISESDSLLLPQSRLRENDLVCVRVGYPGVTAVVTKELEGSNCASMMVIRRGDFDSDWLCFSMNSEIGKQQVKRVQYGAAQKQYNIADAVEFSFAVPPLEEQKLIADYLGNLVEKLDAVEQLSRSQIKLLQERRTALISAAVTGKIDVRNHPSAQPTKKAVA